MFVNLVYFFKKIKENFQTNGGNWKRPSFYCTLEIYSQLCFNLCVQTSFFPALIILGFSFFLFLCEKNQIGIH